MTKKNPRLGSTFESWLDAQGVREVVTAAAIKEIIAEQMKRKGVSQTRMAEMMDEPRPGRPAARSQEQQRHARNPQARRESRGA